MMLRSIFLIPIALGALAGCGLKGPLYLPEDKAQNAATQDDAQQRKERARDSGAQAPAAPTNTTPAQPTTPPLEN